MGLDKVVERPANLRFGSLADICSATDHVRFTPESGHSQAKTAARLSAKTMTCRSSSPARSRKSLLTSVKSELLLRPGRDAELVAST
jgi:hypothetical protein